MTGAPENKKDNKAMDKASQIMKILDQLSKLATSSETKQEKASQEHKFWSTQPVPRPADSCEVKEGPIELSRTIEEVRQEPYPLPPEFKWSIISIDDPSDRDELYQLLNLNYVEDVESLFRFDYPPQFLDWALKVPGWRPEWHVGVRVAETGKLVAFISAIPCSLFVRSNSFNSVEVNFLCVHKRLRSKRLAPLLIREITRRVNLFGIFQALFTAGMDLPGMIGKARYYHRPLNYKNLVEVGFTAVPLGKSVDQMSLRYHLAKDHQFGASLRLMEPSDIPRVSSILSEYMVKFSLRPTLTEEEVKHWLLPRENIIYSYVIEDDHGQIVDFISFYSLPSTVVNNPLHSHIRAAYLFYYASADALRLKKVIHAALIIAKSQGFDVFNCVEIMDNKEFLKDLGFGEGDGYLNYYLYNWNTRPFEPEDVAVVML